MQEKIDLEQRKPAKMDENHKNFIKRIRLSRISEIYWTVKESEEEDVEDPDEYCRLIHNLLMCLYLEDYEIETLKEDMKDRQ